MIPVILIKKWSLYDLPVKIEFFANIRKWAWPKIIFPQRVELATFFTETRHTHIPTILPPGEEMVLPLKSLRSRRSLAKMPK